LRQGESKYSNYIRRQKSLGLPIILGIDFSPDGKCLTAGTYDETIQVWDVRTGQVCHTFSGHQGWVYGVAFSPDGKYLASAGKDITVRLWDLADDQEWLILEGHTAPVRALTFNSIGTLLASSGEDGTVRIWRVKPVLSE
jgi:WD40 repeat protein